MRQGQQNRRGRGRGGSSSGGGNRKGQSPLSRNYESSGPDVKIRGTASQIAEKYSTLARDASSSGDTIMSENYLQHAEHYNRIIMAAQAQATQMVAHGAGDGAQATNGLHRGGRDSAAAPREQSQPQINAQPTDAPQPQPAPQASSPATDDQPSVVEQPAAEEASPPGETKAASASGDASGEAETGRRRRRRYPGNGASRSSSSSSASENGKAEAASSEDHTPDEATA